MLFIHVSNIISKTKSYEEKEFYLKLASKEKYKAKELARQIDSGYYERLLLSNGKAPSAIESKDMTGVLKDICIFILRRYTKQERLNLYRIDMK